ncbi:DoxX family protein [Neolewinella sp.]|uniref:DoxX family protein n=1 Tax=Neolewinella sp. TaxID=2993543 RepID=UPI003B5187D1
MESRKQLTTHAADIGWAIIRLPAGGIISDFGLEILNPDQLAGYREWLTDIGMPYPSAMAYLGKGVELAGGVFLVLGLFTRWAATLLIWVMFVVTFVVGQGNIRSESFYLLLLFSCFVVAGSVRLSLDVFRSGSSAHFRKDQQQTHLLSNGPNTKTLSLV